MKTQNTCVEENMERREKPYRHLAAWVSCLAAIGVAIAANSAREVKPYGAAASGQSMASDAMLAASSAPLSNEFRPSAFPNVMVRAVPETKSPAVHEQSARPDSAHSSASRYRRPGASTKKSTGTRIYGGTTGGTKFVSRPGPGGSTITRFDPAFAPRETAHIDANGVHFKCDTDVAGARRPEVSGQNSRLPAPDASKRK